MKNSLPATMSVAFLHPFFDEMLCRGVTKSELAACISTDQASLYDPSVLVPANSVYAFLSWVASRTDDPLICSRIGQRMARGEWAPLVTLLSSAKTVGDFFLKFSLMSSEQSRAATYKLEIEGAVALWRLVRTPGASSDAAYADAVATGFFTELLRSAAGSEWEPTQIVAVLPDTSFVPQDLLPATSVLTGQAGLTLRFPSTYLVLDMPKVSTPFDLPHLSIQRVRETTLVERVCQLIEHQISDPSLGVDSIAKRIGVTSWKLQALLKVEEMSVSEIKDTVRRKLAIEQVAGSSDTVASIAESLGYSDSSNFTRAFRGWTGKSPRDFRKDR